MEQHANAIKAAGHEITARWVYGGEEGLTRTQIALLDLEDVDKAEIVVSFTHPYGTATTGGGRHAEFGYGLAKGKKLILIGERENVFHHYPTVEVYPDLDAWLNPRPLPDTVTLGGITFELDGGFPMPTQRHIPSDSAGRKQYPMGTGLLDYFPDALAEVAHISYKGNEKHNPGEPTHWARGKSMDHDDCMIRHFIERGTKDVEDMRHSALLAWRALAYLQEELEKEKTLSAPRGAW